MSWITRNQMSSNPVWALVIFQFTVLSISFPSIFFLGGLALWSHTQCICSLVIIQRCKKRNPYADFCTPFLFRSFSRSLLCIFNHLSFWILFSPAHCYHSCLPGFALLILQESASRQKSGDFSLPHWFFFSYALQSCILCSTSITELLYVFCLVF